MCFGQPVNDDVLKLVQEEMATLVISVEKNKETTSEPEASEIRKLGCRIMRD